ncbi:MAG: SDR family oxidoreductase [SAR202 cluster bacterium]|nr:SDR family oxidoreductase [SAR202 cluster bacterium]
MPAEKTLKGRVAIVTGAGRGIGRAIALVFAERGASVVVASRTVPEVEKTARDVKALGARVLAMPTDVSKSSDVDAMVQRTVDEFGKVDILVNNAGQVLHMPVAPFPDKVLGPPRMDRETTTGMSDEEWRRIMDANLSSAFYCCRAVGPHMMKQRYGKVINISSNNGSQAFPYVAAYNASKAGMNMLTRVLALEWAPYSICVNAVGPGEFRTAMTEPSWADPEAYQRHIEHIPMGREAELREVGLMAAYFAGPESDYVTGQIIHIDGGITAR